MKKLKTAILYVVTFLITLSLSSFVWFFTASADMPEEISFREAKERIEKVNTGKAVMNRREFILDDYSNVELPEKKKCIYGESRKFRVYDDYWRTAELMTTARNFKIETADSGFYSDNIFEAGFLNLAYFYVLPALSSMLFSIVLYWFLKQVLL